MKAYNLLIVVLLFLSSPLTAQKITANDLSGVISFNDGEKINYVWLWNTFAGDEIPFSKNLNDLKGSYMDLRRIILKNVKKIIFIPFTTEEITIKKEKFSVTGIRKVNVLFNDGSSKDSIFINCDQCEWKSQNETGRFSDVNIDSVTIFYKLKK